MISKENTESMGIEKRETLRNESGRFVHGTRGGPGQNGGHQKRIQELKTVLLAAVTDDDVKAIAMKLIKEAINGDTMAARILLDRLFGKAEQPVTVSHNEPTDERQVIAVLRKLIGIDTTMGSLPAAGRAGQN